MKAINAIDVKRRLAAAAVALMACGTWTAAGAAAAPQVSFGGQYRINAYSADNDDGAADNQTASRVRIRQGIDLKFDEQFKTHFLFQLNHTTDNTGLTANSLRVRHAVLDYTSGGANMQAGIVPLSDRFGDALFSADWDYNPVAISANFKAGAGDLRLFAANLAEGTEDNVDDDTVHYQIDYGFGMGGGNSLVLAAGLVNMKDPVLNKSRSHSNYGVGGTFGPVNFFVVGSSTDKELLGTTRDGDGVAAKAEYSAKAGSGNVGVLVTYAGGEKDGSGFQPVMALIGHQGYWGYTGILTVQGPTDTGFDGDSVNISNNGYGLTTVQAKYAFPVSAALDGYIAAGWFGGADKGTGRNEDVGTEIMVMGTYHLAPALGLDFGAAMAKLEDSVSGYGKGAAGGFNQAAGVSRDKTAIFARLQAEF